MTFFSKNALEGILAITVTVVVEIVLMKLSVTISMEHVMKIVTLGIKHRTVQMVKFFLRFKLYLYTTY